MSTPADKPPFTDPFELWRQVYEANERAWSAALERTLASPSFAENQGKLLETMLAAQKTVRDNMRTYLETINVPTREDIARLGELIVGVEEKLDQLDERLDGLDARLARLELSLQERGRSESANGEGGAERGAGRRATTGRKE